MSEELNEILTKLNALFDEASELSEGDKKRFKASALRKLGGAMTAADIVSDAERDALLEGFGDNADDDELDVDVSP